MPLIYLSELSRTCKIQEGQTSGAIRSMVGRENQGQVVNLGSGLSKWDRGVPIVWGVTIADWLVPFNIQDYASKKISELVMGSDCTLV